MFAPQALRASFCFISYSSASFVLPVECDTCARVCAACAPRREEIQAPGKARVPLTTYSRRASARLSLC